MLFSALILTAFIDSCSSTQIKHTMHTRSFIDQVNLVAVQYFTPSYLPSEHDDFKKKMEKLDCRAPSEFYQKLYNSLTAKELIQCLNSIESGQAQYIFSFQAQPKLDVDPDENQPDCLKKLLPSIPLPREIYFLGKVDPKQALECYSASFNTEQGSLMGTGILTKKLKFQIPFPLSRELKSDRDLLIWLMVTTLDLMSQGLDGGGKQIHADVVPDSTCRQCFGKDPLFDAKKSEKIPASMWND